jgi:hypothetical protein
MVWRAMADTALTGAALDVETQAKHGVGWVERGARHPAATAAQEYAYVVRLSANYTGSMQRTTMKDIPKGRGAEFAKQVDAARLHVVEMCALAFIEGLLGRVPTEAELEANAVHIPFSSTPLTVYEKSGIRFCNYFAYGREVIALGFHNSNDILALQTCRVARDDWPPALVAWMHEHRPNKPLPPA